MTTSYYNLYTSVHVHNEHKKCSICVQAASLLSEEVFLASSLTIGTTRVCHGGACKRARVFGKCEITNHLSQ